MAFASTIQMVTDEEVPEQMGRKKVVFGTFTNGAGDSGGDIVTGLDKVDDFDLQPTGAAVLANQVSVNETFPFNEGNVTIVTDLDVDGIWMAIGTKN